ncbi:uncharacterized protein [Palaemon carinicauda]|uniref:uncharacterized protein n=1 Tax=Palaemon carinicauda TaxID=392227 RepID=UPI0035B59CC4
MRPYIQLFRWTLKRAMTLTFFVIGASVFSILLVTLYHGRLLQWHGAFFGYGNFAAITEVFQNGGSTSKSSKIRQLNIADDALEFVIGSSSSPNTKASLSAKDWKLMIDASPELSDLDVAARVQERAPNLPVLFWQKVRGKNLAMNRTCAKFPSLFNLNYYNTYWQTLETSEGTFHLYGAYFDNRSLSENKPSVHILSQIDRINVNISLYCQFWFDGHQKPIFSNVYKYNLAWKKEMGMYKNGILQPYLFSCHVPGDYGQSVPQAVSLVEKPCDMAKVNLRVFNNLPESGSKEDFAVCVKGLTIPFSDQSARLVEWLELLFILGANKVFLYEFEVHPNVSKVLSYYKKLGKVEVTKLILAAKQPSVFGIVGKYLKHINFRKSHQEMIPYNDCFLKNINKYKFISALDIDEVIFPKKFATWKELMDYLVPQALGSGVYPSNYVPRHVYFFDDVSQQRNRTANAPYFMHMLRNIRRSIKYNKPTHYVKCFHDTERVLTIHNHFPITCIGGKCESFYIDTDTAQLHHYRSECVRGLRKVCDKEYKNQTVMDPSILRYQNRLIARVNDTLVRLGFLK